MSFETGRDSEPAGDRRDFLRNCGRFAVTVPPVLTVLLSTSLSSPAIAKSTAGGDHGNGHGNGIGHHPKGNNGLGNGPDPQPPGNPPINDGPGSGPGNPGHVHQNSIASNVSAQTLPGSLSNRISADLRHPAGRR